MCVCAFVGVGGGWGGEWGCKYISNQLTELEIYLLIFFVGMAFDLAGLYCED